MAKDCKKYSNTKSSHHPTHYPQSNQPYLYKMSGSLAIEANTFKLSILACSVQQSSIRPRSSGLCQRHFHLPRAYHSTQWCLNSLHSPCSLAETRSVNSPCSSFISLWNRNPKAHMLNYSPIATPMSLKDVQLPNYNDLTNATEYWGMVGSL